MRGAGCARAGGSLLSPAPKGCSRRNVSLVRQIYFEDCHGRQASRVLFGPTEIATVEGTRLSRREPVCEPPKADSYEQPGRAFLD
jgi:hypothetical protein